jgi:hypothetical protein
MELHRRNPLRRHRAALCISLWHFGLTQFKTRALNSLGLVSTPALAGGNDPGQTNRGLVPVEWLASTRDQPAKARDQPAKAQDEAGRHARAIC